MGQSQERRRNQTLRTASNREFGILNLIGILNLNSNP